MRVTQKFSESTIGNLYFQINRRGGLRNNALLGDFMQIPFSNCVLLGVGATPDQLRTDGDILIATPDNIVLFSEGVMYFNGEQVGFANADLLDAIRDAMKSITPRNKFT